MVETAGQPPQVALAVAVGVREPADEHFIEDRLLVPPGVAGDRVHPALAITPGLTTPGGEIVMESQQQERLTATRNGKPVGRWWARTHEGIDVLDITIRRPAAASVVCRLDGDLTTDEATG